MAIDDTTKLAVLKSTAIRQAMTEFISENRAEILKRAKAKLIAMGIAVEEAEFEQPAGGASEQSQVL